MQFIQCCFGLAQVVAAQVVHKATLAVIRIFAQSFLLFSPQGRARITVEVPRVGIGEYNRLVVVIVNQRPIIARSSLAGALLQGCQLGLVSLLNQVFQLRKTGILIPVRAQEFAIFPSKSPQVVLFQAQGRLTPGLSDGIVAFLVNDAGDFTVELFGYIIAVEANGVAQLLDPAAVIQLATTVQDILNFSAGSFPDFVAQVIERLIAELVFFDKINGIQISVFFVLKSSGLFNFTA